MPSKGQKKCPNCGKFSRCTCRSSERAMAASDPKLQSKSEHPKHKLADRLQAKREAGLDTAPHLIVIARAGTGKTTTLVEGLKVLKGLKPHIIPSPQQAAIWESILLSKGRAQSVCFVAFNKAIATELQARVPKGCDAMTMHSMGFKAVRRTFGNVRVNSYRVQDIIAELTEQDIRELRRYKAEVLKATEKLVGLCKMNLSWLVYFTTSCIEDTLANLAAYYDVDLNGNAQEVFTLVPRVLERCKDVARDGCVDFNDMIWLPVALNLSMYRYDLLLVDEAQDLNRCQQELALKAGRRLVLCGDPKQAIYGFAGADCESLPRMEVRLAETKRGVERLPLTVTRRCGKAIVKEARKYVPDFEAHESNGDGSLRTLPFQGIAGEPLNNYAVEAKNGDMILSRVNAPLVSECFKFLKAGRKANIQGRDVGQGLINLIKRMKVDLVEDLVRKLEDWRYAEERKEQAKRNPSEARLIALADRYDCILCFAEGQATVEQVVQRIEAVFTDDKNGKGIMLSSIHKAKGLEADRVFFLRTKEAPCPHPMARTPQAREQELNLLYVAITRARKELVYVS